MPTLYVENVPEDVYEALRARAQGNGKSISAEVLALLAESVPTPRELARRRDVVTRMRKIRSRQPGQGGPFPSTEQMLREDRSR
jgi:plasmid stability protein